MKLADFPKLQALPARQKLQLAEELWHAGVSDASLTVPAWHKEVLSKRMAAYKAGKLISVAELKRRLRVKWGPSPSRPLKSSRRDTAD